jgi:hypothetical protein
MKIHYARTMDEVAAIALVEPRPPVVKGRKARVR